MEKMGCAAVDRLSFCAKGRSNYRDSGRKDHSSFPSDCRLWFRKMNDFFLTFVDLFVIIFVDKTQDNFEAEAIPMVHI